MLSWGAPRGLTTKDDSGNLLKNFYGSFHFRSHPRPKRSGKPLISPVFAVEGCHLPISEGSRRHIYDQAGPVGHKRNTVRSAVKTRDGEQPFPLTDRTWNRSDTA